jgi:hypothetical protein
MIGARFRYGGFLLFAREKICVMPRLILFGVGIAFIANLKILLGLELWFLFRCGVIFQFIKDVLAIILFS